MSTPAPQRPRGHLAAPLHRNIEALHKARLEHARDASLSDRIAAAITRFTGSMTFVIVHLVIYGSWILINLGAVPGVTPFDPTFVILATEASVEAIFLSTFVLISQNRQAAAADQRADLDLHVNLLAEHELTKLAAVITAIADKLGVPIDDPEGMDEVKKNVRPEEVMGELDGKRAELDGGPD